ncbi:hypothetical protein ACS0TY_010807 [Phlomoides rotata]
MLGKFGWRIMMNPDALVSSIVKAKYFSCSNFLESSLGSNPSYTWRSIHEAKDLVD